ncbi:ATP-binding cassette domain-containing protein [Plantibacter cousiniae (nom. nud.)]
MTHATPVHRRAASTFGRSIDIQQLRADGVTRSYGDRVVLRDVDLVVSAGDRLGLIGENGAGKSTLLRILAGIDEPDDGEAVRPVRTGILMQELELPEGTTVGELLEQALGEVRAVEQELETSAAALGETGSAGDGSAEQRYAAALDAAERADVWTADARLDAVVDGLGIAAIERSRRLGEVSGGQRSRFALAALLVARPTALLLDEPTNHLDDEAVAFLRGHLSEWPGPVLFASHDRAFLDEVATGLVDIDPSRPVPVGEASPVVEFGGPFSEYLDWKAAELDRWSARHEEEQAELRRLASAVHDVAPRINHDRGIRDNNRMAFGMRGDRVEQQISRRVRNAQLRLEVLEREQVRRPPRQLSFAGIPSGSTVLDEGEQLPILFDTVQAAFLAGYAAADYSKTGVVGTFGGQPFPSVQIFMDGFAEGVAYYNEQKGKSVQVVGWDVAAQTGSFTGGFEANDTAKQLARTLIDQNADVLLPVGGPIFLSAIAEIQETGKDIAMIGVDADLYETNAENKGLFLTSILKGMKAGVADTVTEAGGGKFDAAAYIGTLENEGVGLAPFHDFESKVSPTLADELDTIKAGIIDGSIKATSVSSPVK